MEILKQLDLTELQILKYGKILVLWEDDPYKEMKFSTILGCLKLKKSTLINYLNELCEIEILEKIYKKRASYYRYTKKGKEKLTEMLKEIFNLSIKMEKIINDLKMDEIEVESIKTKFGRVSDTRWREILNRFIVTHMKDPSKIVAYYSPIVINEKEFFVFSFFPNQEFQEIVKKILWQYRTKKERNQKLKELMRPILEEIKPLFDQRLQDWMGEYKLN